ncbi:MAG: hypothetical protein AAB116_26380 [Candidatus Poribacteria bacterium]
MSWKSGIEINNDLKNFPQIKRLELAYNLRTFIIYAIYPNDYLASPNWQDSIVLTESGQALLEFARPGKKKIQINDIYMALFLHLYYHELLIDVENTNLDLIRSTLNDELLNFRIHLPYRYGRLLYDKFNNTVQSNRIESLDAEESIELLKDTPQGVYQMGKILSGPFGLLTSQETRFLPPSSRIPLWHCSDTGCSAIHHVELDQSPVPISDAFHCMSDLAEKQMGPKSEWEIALMLMYKHEQYQFGRPYYDLPALLADAVLDNERTNLLAFALDSENGLLLRNVIGSAPRRKNLAEGTSNQVSTRLTESEQLQILLLLKDFDLVGLIDEYVSEGKIQIPHSEIRRPKATPPSPYSRNYSTELLSFGIRSIRGNPLISLASAIWSAYENQNLLDELKWKLGKSPTRNSLMDYISKSPEEAIRDLVISSEPITLELSKRLNIKIPDYATKDYIIKSFLWKFGFGLPRYNDEYSRLRERLELFNNILMETNSIKTESDRQAIRSVGVNLFVSVEYFIGQLISYNIWLLSSDHFEVTRFQYNSHSAFDSVKRTLGEEINLDDYRAIWNENGVNTLGTLMAYLQKSLKWMLLLPNQEKDVIKRPKEGFPHYADDPEMFFPFRHTEMWADCEPSELDSFIDKYKKIVDQLNKSNLASIRNGLDHRRDDVSFPSINGMIECVKKLQEAFDLTDNNRFIPKEFWLNSYSFNRFGREQYIYYDYMNRDLQLNGPNPIINKESLQTFDSPILIAPGNLLDLPNSSLIFGISEDSAYSKYWSGYPRRRKIPKSEESEKQMDTTSDQDNKACSESEE